MKRAIRAHRFDAIAIGVLVVLAALVTTYVLEHQPAFTFGRSYYVVNAEFSQASAVTAGQGQAITIAGVQVGQVGGVHLKDGVAVVQMDIDKRDAPIYRNATVLMRPRTPLKDMYLELDPGTRAAGRIPAGGTLSTAHTAPDVDVSEILSSLDADSRNYLVLLLAAGAGALHDPGFGASERPSPGAVRSLRATLERFAPLDRHTRTFASLLAARQQSLRLAVHRLALVAGALGSVDRQLASLISASDESFSAIAAGQRQIRQTLAQFPPTLRQTDVSLQQVKRFATASATTLTRLQPFAHHLAPALAAARPLLRDTTPVIARELRPFSVAVQPLARTLAPAAASLKTSVPPLSDAIGELNGLFNELAYAPKGNHSYLFYAGWLAHITDSVVSSQDANGAIVQGLFIATCPALAFYETGLQVNNQPLGVILDLLNMVPIDQIPGAKRVAGTDIYTCSSGG